MPLDQTELDALWDFDDPTGSAARFAAAASRARDSARAELDTQRARALGLQGRFEEADAILDDIADDSPVVGVRIALERGRLRNSSGESAAAVPLFRQAAAQASSAGLLFLQVDALHMLAIADAPHASDWTAEALAVLDATDDPRTLRWRVALHNNAGWAYVDAGNRARALAEFEKAKDAALRWGTPQQVRWADEALEAARSA